MTFEKALHPGPTEELKAAVVEAARQVEHSPELHERASKQNQVVNIAEAKVADLLEQRAWEEQGIDAEAMVAAKREVGIAEEEREAERQLLQAMEKAGQNLRDAAAQANQKVLHVADRIIKDSVGAMEDGLHSELVTCVENYMVLFRIRHDVTDFATPIDVLTRAIYRDQKVCARIFKRVGDARQSLIERAGETET